MSAVATSDWVSRATRVRGEPLPEWLRFTYDAKEHGAEGGSVDLALRLETGRRLPILYSPSLPDDLVVRLGRVVDETPEVLLRHARVIILPGVDCPRSSKILGTCTRDNDVIVWGTPALLEITPFSLVLHHELAHCVGARGGPPDAGAWDRARRRDAARRVPIEWRVVRPRYSEGVSRVSIRAGTPWITGYAEETGLVAEDWAESVMLYLADSRRGRFVGRRRFSKVFPHRAALVDRLLEVGPSGFGDRPRR